MDPVLVLSTKKLNPDLNKTAAEHGIQIIEKEMITIRFLFSEKHKEIIDAAMEDQARALVFTSSNAVEAYQKYGPESGKDRKIYCLSGKTRQAVAVHPQWGRVAGEAPNAAALARVIIDQQIKKVLFLCGNRRRDELPAILEQAGVAVQEVVVYETLEKPIAVQGPFEAVLFFSPSGVDSFFAANQLSDDTICLAIGSTTAKAIEKYAGNQIVVSPEPSPETLIKALITYFNQGTIS